MSVSSKEFTLSDHVQRSDSVVTQEIRGEAVLLDLASEQYFGLDTIGSRIWALLADTSHLETVCSQISAGYEAPIERIHADVLTLVGQLAEAGLLTRR